jgi:predicted O-methyltransferase YrrM
VAHVYQSDDCQTYKMDYRDPHRSVEPLFLEIRVVDGAIAKLHEAGILADTAYDHRRMLIHRHAVAETFDIPWTAITHRMQRLLYAINAIAQPQNMIAAGVFCGNTFISNAGAAVGPGACYAARNLIGVEIRPEEAKRAERNVRLLDRTGVARVVAADAIDVCRDFEEDIHLLYLDADGTPETGKGIYLNILEAAYDKMPPGAIVCAHNSVNCAARLEHYLAFVRDPAHLRESVNVIFDREGLEVSVK